MKFSLLVHLLRKEDPELGLIFCNSRRDVDLVTQNLRNNGINAEAIHGGLAQNRREHVIERFHNGGIDVLVATDVAARGLDFKDITHIFNYSVPRDPEDYVNRIGRTARAGKRGKAIVLLSREDFDLLSRVVNTFDFNLQEIEATNVEVLPFKRNNYRDGGNGGRQFRGSGYGRRSEGNGSNSYGRRDRGYYGDHSGRGDRQGSESRSNDPALLSRGYSPRRNQYGSSSYGKRYN
jgi:ATP-dependent RNA helicase DeaD